MRSRSISSRQAPTCVLFSSCSDIGVWQTTAQYLRIASTTVCSTASPLDLLPRPVPERTQDVD